MVCATSTSNGFRRRVPRARRQGTAAAQAAAASCGSERQQRQASGDGDKSRSGHKGRRGGQAKAAS